MNDLARSVQIALLGEVPSTLRFLYVYLKDGVLYFHAVFTSEATDEHLESANCVLTELSAAWVSNDNVNYKIERNDSIPWKINGGENLMYLRYGELENA